MQRRRDNGGCIGLKLQGVPVDHVDKRVRVIGVIVAPDVVGSDSVMGL